MRALATDAVERFASRLPRETVVVLTDAAEAVAVEGFLAAPLRGPLVLWAPTGGDAAFAGRGEVVRIDAAGSGRFGDVRARAAEMFATLVEHRAPGCDDAPTPRLFGGAAFQPGAAAAAPWAAFGDASFAMPRWAYGRTRAGAFLRLAVRADELLAPARLLTEVDEVTTALARAAHSRPEALPDAGAPAVRDEMGPSRWDALIRDALTHIRSREFEKVVAARRSHLAAGATIDMATVLRRLRDAHPECVRFAFQRGDAVFTGATPERLVARRGPRLDVDALAGSIPRSSDPDADAAGARALLASDKDQREHDHVVRGILAALARFDAAVDPHDAPRLRTLRNVHHLWTPLTAQLRRPAHVLELVEALHPTPAVCGLPRETAAAWIAAHEPCARGWYAAPVGWFDGAGDGAFAVAIRSAVVQSHEAWLYAGSGIVEGSDPAAEYRETTAKHAAMLTALGVAL